MKGESNEGWRVGKGKDRCAGRGCALPPGAPYFALLNFLKTEEHGLQIVREDLCEICFRSLERRSEDPPIFWRGRRKTGKGNEPVLDLASLRVLFDRLGEVDEEKARSLRYFAALLLLRKRVLRMVDPRNEEEERADLVVIDPKAANPEPVALFAPDLDLDDMGALKDDLLAALEGGVDSEEGADDSAAASPSAKAADAGGAATAS